MDTTYTSLLVIFLKLVKGNSDKTHTIYELCAHYYINSSFLLQMSATFYLYSIIMECDIGNDINAFPLSIIFDPSSAKFRNLQLL